MSDIPDPIYEPILDTPETTPSTKGPKGPKDSPNESNNPVTISIKGLNKADYHLIVYDERWIRHTDMISLAHDMKLHGYHFSIIPVAEDPSKAIHHVGADSREKGKEEGQGR